MKKNIETVQGTDVYAAAQQELLYRGKVLKDGTTLEENGVAENSLIVLVLRLSKVQVYCYSVCARIVVLIFCNGG